LVGLNFHILLKEAERRMGEAAQAGTDTAAAGGSLR